MSELIVPLTDDERGLIANELEKLFIFHDKAMGKEKKAILVDELVEVGLPFKAILYGLRSLKNEELKSIKLSTLVAACRLFLEPEAQAQTPCRFCNEIGMVPMMVEDWGCQYEKALACFCANGKKHPGCVVWNGEATQSVKGKIYSYRWPKECGNAGMGEHQSRF